MKADEEIFDKVTIIKHPTFDQAQQAAYLESASTGGFTFPIVIAKQGERRFLSGALPIKFIETRLIPRSAIKGASMADAKSATNRPLESKHAQDIAKYLVENVDGKYIIPSLTLNVQEPVNVYTISSGGNFKLGFLAMPIGVTFSITDGQHRMKGLLEAIIALEKTNPDAAHRLRDDSLSVMIMCESELSQVHQDFADCSKTKALPPSLLSVFDTRNPANRILADIVAECPLFTGKIDSTSKTLSKKSTNLFLANQVRQLIKHLLVRGNPADSEFEKRAHELLGEKRQYKKYLDWYVAFVNRVTQAIPVLREIAEIDPDSPKKGLIPKYREEDWVCLTATGMNVIGTIGHELFTHDVKDWETFVDKLGALDWKKNSPFWEGTIIQGGRVITQTTPVRKAAGKAMQEIGLKSDLGNGQGALPLDAPVEAPAQGAD
ncbi:DGQHR domain-containing protein [Humidesulfovibrio mexicanus]|uniref:DGQHR domain-containing protein n=1 Tax=Humidesulfovibrio mexicanus TaxID=147047 RepID=A0A239B842_9BACT|nr:DNA sulfur modification protein DndB [Humidesulfovibrio mexicanus]SNS03354.1 DGQHR domain-containing protein [Humidesulfovibrio mexicanus]